MYDTLAREDVQNALRALAVRYDGVLTGTAGDVLRAHPIAEMWSALEYGCHVRDVFRVQRERIELALAEDQPAFASMRREERVAEERYNEQRPADVARQTAVAADALARRLEALDADGWNRTGLYSWPERRVRTVEWIGRHTVHEGEHHLMDIDRLVTITPG